MKIKLLTIFLLAVSAVVLVGYISYEGLSKLMVSLESATKPDDRKDHFNALIYSLSEAENSVRIYTITRESQYLASFYSAVNEVDYQMEILYRFAEGDPVLALHLDSIHSLIEKKIDLQKQLIELKEDLTQIDVYQHVLEKIQSIEKKNEVLDSMENEIIKLNADPKPSEETAVYSEEKEPEEKKGFFKRLFSSKKTNKDEEEEKTAEIITDSTLTAKANSVLKVADTLKKEKISAEIRSSLAEIKSKEQELSKDLTATELSLTKRDQEVSDRIKLEVSKVDKYFYQQKIKTAEQASGLFDETTQLITIVGTVSAMLFLVLVFIILNDIQVNQRFRKRLERAKKRAEDLAVAKEDFLSNMSHEIRTPMNAILGFTEQLNGSALKKEQQKYLKIIKNASHHLLSIINDILDYNKLEAGKVNIEKVPFSVVENAHIVYDTLLLNAKEKGLDFKLNIDNLFQTKNAVGDPVRFRQILFNLAGNAIKFTEKGFVEIDIRYQNTENAPHLEMLVKDSGIGISDYELETIFNKFDQADQSISKKYGGTGLGLAIVKKLAELQNGDVKVNSELHKGSTFSVQLPYPLMEAEEETVPEQREVSEKDDLLGKRILVVDDEEYNLLLLETILKKHNAYTRTAQSGKDALKALNKEPFDMVLLDLQMKEMDGFQTIKKIREEIPCILPIVAITASASQAIHHKCEKAGFIDIVLKPVNEKEFTEQLYRHFQNNGQKITENGEKTQTDFSENLQHVFSLMQNDEAVAINMVNIYQKSIRETKNIITKSLKKGDFKSIQEASHKVIPSTRHMGFEELVNKLKFAENNLTSKQDLITHTYIVEEICSDIDNIDKWLVDFLKNQQGQNSVVS